jgi:hypothetical protein
MNSWNVFYKLLRSPIVAPFDRGSGQGCAVFAFLMYIQYMQVIRSVRLGNCSRVALELLRTLLKHVLIDRLLFGLLASAG